MGYDADYGACPLKRAIQRELQNLLAVKMLGGEFHEGETIHVERGKEGPEFTALAQINSWLRNAILHHLVAFNNPKPGEMTLFDQWGNFAGLVLSLVTSTWAMAAISPGITVLGHI